MPSDTFILLPDTISADFYAESYARVLPDVETIPEHALAPYNMNATSVAATVFAAAPKIAAYEARIRAHAPTVSMEALYALVPLAAALVQADVAYATSTQPKKPFLDLVARASALRIRLSVSARVLVKLGALGRGALDEVTSSPSYKAMAKDLGVLAHVYQDYWADIEGRSMITAADLDEARALSVALMRGIGEREQSSERSDEIARTRQRIFTRLAKVYGTARTAVAFVCALEETGDVDEIAPSIYSGRKARKVKPREVR